MEFELRENIFALLILLGVVQGFFLSIFFLLDYKNDALPNRILGWLLLAISLIITEILLNYTGYITRVIMLDNFSESVSFAIGPLLYLYVNTSLSAEWKKRYWLHFIPFFLYTLYMIFYFIQSDQYKFNSFLWAYHPEITTIPASQTVTADPLGLRNYINLLILMSFTFYGIKSWLKLAKEVGANNKTIWHTGRTSLVWLRNFLLHFFLAIIMFLLVKLFFGRDLGDYIIASYLALLMYITNLTFIRNRISPDPDGDKKLAEKPKYSKSSLSESEKRSIVEKVYQIMNNDQYFTNNLASLNDLSRRLSIPSHHLSQVINEKLEYNFFELLAQYRVTKAREILSDPSKNQLTVEEVAWQVGYNSKSTFNKVFKKQTGFTPSEFRNQQ